MSDNTIPPTYSPASGDRQPWPVYKDDGQNAYLPGPIQAQQGLGHGRQDSITSQSSYPLQPDLNASPSIHKNHSFPWPAGIQDSPAQNLQRASSATIGGTFNRAPYPSHDDFETPDGQEAAYDHDSVASPLLPQTQGIGANQASKGSVEPHPHPHATSASHSLLELAGASSLEHNSMAEWTVINHMTAEILRYSVHAYKARLPTPKVTSNLTATKTPALDASRFHIWTLRRSIDQKSVVDVKSGQHTRHRSQASNFLAIPSIEYRAILEYHADPPTAVNDSRAPTSVAAQKRARAANDGPADILLAKGQWTATRCKAMEALLDEVQGKMTSLLLAKYDGHGLLPADAEDE